MSSEVDDFFAQVGEAESGERIDTARPQPRIDTTVEPEIEDPHREGTVVGRGAEGARRSRPAAGRYTDTASQEDPDLFEDQGGARVIDDDRDAARVQREAGIADREEVERAAAASGSGAHRQEGLEFFTALDEGSPAVDETRYAGDGEPTGDDNDAFFDQIGVDPDPMDDPMEEPAVLEDDDDFSIEAIEKGARKKRNLMRGAGISTLAVVVLGGGGYLAVSFVSGLMDSTRAETQQQYAAPEWATEVGEPVEAGVFDDLFMAAPAYTIDAQGQTYWVAAGIADITEDEFTLYSSADGEEVAEVEMGVDDFDYLVEFRHESEPVVGLRTAEGMTAVRADGEVTDIEFEGSLRVDGEAPLVYVEEQAHRIDFEEGLVEIDINNDLSIVAADDELIYQVTGDGTLVTIPEGEEAQAAEVDMVAPEEGAEFIGWAGAGHGYAGAYWETDSGDHLGVHDAADGEATAYVPVETTGYWEVGRGLSAAVVDRYAISLITGEVLAADPQIEGAYSHYGYTEDRRFIESNNDGAYAYTEDSQVIGASGTTIFVRTATGNIDAYDRNDQTV